jgi:lysozyme
MNAAGLELLKHFEGFRSDAYPDPATGAEPWTIGYGFTRGVQPGDTITREDADERLKVEVAEYEGDVLKVCKRMPSPNQLAAMTSLAFNVGLGNFRSSTVLRRHNSGETFAAANAFLLWNRANGRVMAGLTRRREAERALYLLA